MDKSDTHPPCNKLGLFGNHSKHKLNIGLADQLRVMTPDCVVRKPTYGLNVIARGKIFKGSDANVACSNAGQDRPWQWHIAIHKFPRGNNCQSASGWNAEMVHGLAHQVFTQHWPYRGLTISTA